jgi:hypothetical protein
MLIKSEKINQQVGTIVPAPLPESQTRELGRAPEDKRGDAIERAKEKVGKGPLTAKVIREAVQEVIDADDEPLAVDSDASDAEPLDETPKPSEAPKGAVSATWMAIEDEIAEIATTIGNCGRMADLLDCIAECVNDLPAVAYAHLCNLAVKIRKG